MTDPWLRRLVWWGFWLRAGLALVLEYTGYGRQLAPDEWAYSEGGWGLALYWAGKLMVMPERFTTGRGPFGYFYMNAALFTVFGHTEIPARLLNSFIGAWSSRYVYAIARELFDEGVARRAAVLFCYFPSLVLWSSLNIRDIWVVALILLISWTSLLVATGRSTFRLLELATLIYALSLFRDYLVLAVAFPPVVAFLIGRRGRLVRNFAVGCLAAVVLMVVLNGVALGPDPQRRMSLEALAEARQGLSSGGSAYYSSTDISTPGRALAFLPIAAAYYFFSPFPWQITSVLKLLSLPEMLLVYYLTPATVRGVRLAFRSRLRECLQIFLLTSMLTVSYSLMEGNVGTLYRHRAQTAAFYLIFAAVGLEAAARERSRARQRLPIAAVTADRPQP